MATTPMTFNVEMPWVEYENHPLTVEWLRAFKLSSDPMPNFLPYLKREYNINIIDTQCGSNWYSSVVVEFHSEQDYILWQLHQ